MNAFAQALSDVFDRGAERRLDLETERATIALAKGGDSDATVALVYAYAPVLRGYVGQYRHAGGGSAGTIDADDLRQAAVTGLLEAIAAFDPEQHERLAAVVAGYIADGLSSSGVGPVAFTVPPRTLSRFYGILRAAGGDPIVAAELAPSYHMTTDTFAAVLSAVREADSYDVLVASQMGSADEAPAGEASLLASAPGPTIADAEERILVEAAFAAVGPLEESVVRLAYGFADYEPLPDIEVAFRLGLSRPTAQRTRTSALATMRTALGVA